MCCLSISMLLYYFKEGFLPSLDHPYRHRELLLWGHKRLAPITSWSGGDVTIRLENHVCWEIVLAERSSQESCAATLLIHVQKFACIYNFELSLSSLSKMFLNCPSFHESREIWKYAQETTDCSVPEHWLTLHSVSLGLVDPAFII